MLKDASAIVGIGETPFAKQLEGSEKQLAAAAILAALDDAGIDASEVDGLASYTLETSDEVEIAKTLEVTPQVNVNKMKKHEPLQPSHQHQLLVATRRRG